MKTYTLNFLQGEYHLGTLRMKCESLQYIILKAKFMIRAVDECDSIAIHESSKMYSSARIYKFKGNVYSKTNGEESEKCTTHTK